MMDTIWSGLLWGMGFAIGVGLVVVAVLTIDAIGGWLIRKYGWDVMRLTKRRRSG